MKQNTDFEGLENIVNAVKCLSIDAVQKANSGHPGMPMGAAHMATVLWHYFHLFNPDDPTWPLRDRFVLSAGHGSMLLYSLLHLYGFDLSIEDIKQFRQLDSRTPGHPEYGVTPGVDVTTGPLGQGFANGVGMAIASLKIKSDFKEAPDGLLSNFVYGIVSDGDLMEGISTEAASIAGHLKLSNLIYLYDSNRITIDGSTDISFSEDIPKKFEALGWHVQSINGHDCAAIYEAIALAQQSDLPSLIVARTHIAHQSPTKQDSAKSHGAPLGEEEIAQFKKNIAWEADAFSIPQSAYALCQESLKLKKDTYQQRQSLMKTWEERDAESYKRYVDFYKGPADDNLDRARMSKLTEAKSEATRKTFQRVLNDSAKDISQIISGSADLAGSTYAVIEDQAAIQASDYSHRNIAFGIREHAMGAIANGIALYGYHVPVTSTFLVFSDYMRTPVRLAALSELRSIFVFTHDSIFVGEDGPTHQPIEHLTSLRAIPNCVTIRPANLLETQVYWSAAMKRKDGPSVFCLSRQAIPALPGDALDRDNVNRGAYVFSPCDKPQLTIAASGAELSLAYEVTETLRSKGIKVRLVSVPCLEIFEKQDRAYQAEMLPTHIPCLVVEAADATSWYRFLGPLRDVVEIRKFGKSAPAESLAKLYGFNVAEIAVRAEKLIG